MSKHKIDLFLIKYLFKLVQRIHRRENVFDLNDIHKILIINTTAIGDTLMSTPAIRAIRRSYPDSRIIAMVSPAAKEVLSANPHIDGFIDHRGKVDIAYLLNLPHLLRKMSLEQFDVSIVLHGNDPDIAPLSYLSGAKIRTGWSTSKLSFLFTHPVETKVDGVHEIDVRLNNLKALGVEPDGRHMELFITKGEEDYVGHVLKRMLLDSEKPIAIHPFSSKKLKAWSVEEAAKLARLFTRKLGQQVVIIGGRREAGLADQLQKRAGNGVFNFAGVFKLRQSAALLDRCQMLVTTDSGPMHIAQALNVPTIVLIGPTIAERTGPINKNSLIIQARSGQFCKDPMKSIEADFVFERAERFLQRIP